MTIQDWLTATEAQLTDAGVETARLDALVLLSDELQHDKSWLLAYSDYNLQGSEINNLNTKIMQRMAHTPLAYIRGHVEFYGREFAVDEHVLVPRPESEAIIDLLKKIIPDDTRATIADIGTGSGALAITANLERSNTKVIAVDIDPACLKVAEQNARTLGATVEFRVGNLLEPLKDTPPADPLVLLCNLPYVPAGYQVNEAAKHEPELALYSGKDGMDSFRELFASVDSLAFAPSYIVTESLEVQFTGLESLAMEHGYTLEQRVGLVQCFKRSPPR